MYLCGCDTKKPMLEEIETRQDGSLGCSVVAVITVCVCICVVVIKQEGAMEQFSV